MRFAVSSFCFTALLLLSSCGSKSNGPATVAETLTAAQAVDGAYISWKEHRIDDERMGKVPIRGADGLKMADLDKDGFLDIVSVHEDSSHIRLAFGSASPNDWFRLTLGEGPEAAAAEDVAIGDLNRDGYPDVIAACEKGHLIYFQNPGGTVRGWRWQRVIPPVTTGRGSFIRVFLADLNKDGNLNVVTANKGGTAISWFEVPPDPLDGSAWLEHVLANVRMPINSVPVDLDGDGDIDILAGSRGERRILWLENIGGKDPAFREHAIQIGQGAAPLGPEVVTGGFNVDFFDFSGDGRLDIVLPTFSKAIVWLEQPGDPAEPWSPHFIGTISPDDPAGIVVADINGDGKPDVMTGGYSRGPRLEDGPEITASDPVGRIAWFENPGNPEGPWRRHDVSRRKRGMYDAFIPRDMDGDGDVDFVATRGNSAEYDGVFWLEQVRSKKPVRAFTQARKSESQQLPLPRE